MLFRTPTDEPGANAKFYEDGYEQGFTTTLPTDSALDAFKKTNFSGTEKDYSYYIDTIGQLGLKRGARLFDYGCSWGYGSYQLTRAGFNVVAFEISPTRRRYAAEKLGVRTVADMDRAVVEFAGQFDCFFSAHVLEHVPSPNQAFAYALQQLAPGGLFVSFTPNGSAACRAKLKGWSGLWGEVHPNFIDEVFLDYNFICVPRCIGSSPVQSAALPSSPNLRRLDNLERVELFFAARKNGIAWA
jgi:cyclopropane fatty-acyl-phospholipid synthase-like methyltransferase